jgi:hypothetical protein
MTYEDIAAQTQRFGTFFHVVWKSDSANRDWGTIAAVLGIKEEIPA